jgi:O-antigen/teichoic acid export membrane protein
MKEMLRDIRPGLHLAKGSMSILLANALLLPTGFITAVFLARYLGPMYYGLFALASRFVIWVEWSSTSFLSGTTIKFVGEAKDWRPIGVAIVRLHLMIGFGVATLLWILSTPLAELFSEPAMGRYLRLFAIEVPIFSLACANLNILLGLGRFKEQARITAGRVFARMVLIILLVEMGLSVEGAIIGSIGASAVELFWSTLYIRPPLLSKCEVSSRPLLGLAVPLFMSAMSLRIFRLDLFVLKTLGGTAAQAGYYGAAMNLSIPPTLYSGSISSPLLSTINRLISTGKTEQAKEIGMNALRSVLWLLPLAAMMAGAAPEIVLFILGEPYLSASFLLSLLIFADLSLGIIGVSRSILIASGRPGWTFLLSGPMVPLALLGHLMMIPWLGPVGAALVTTSVAFLVALASLYAVYRAWRVFPSFKTFFACGLCSGIAFSLAVLWPASGITLLLKLLVIICAILLAFRLLGEFTAREMDMFRSMVGRILRPGTWRGNGTISEYEDKRTILTSKNTRLDPPAS